MSSLMESISPATIANPPWGLRSILPLGSFISISPSHIVSTPAAGTGSMSLICRRIFS